MFWLSLTTAVSKRVNLPQKVHDEHDTVRGSSDLTLKAQRLWAVSFAASTSAAI